VKEQNDSLADLRSDDPRARAAALQRIAATGRATPDELEQVTACLAAKEKLVQKGAAEALAALHRTGADVRSRLRSILRSADLRERWGATFALSLIGPLPSEALGVLLESLGFDDGDIRWAAAELLLKMPERGGHAARLVELLASHNPRQRKMAAYCLRTLGVRSSEIDAALCHALTDARSEVRLAALAALSRLALDPTGAAQHVALRIDDVDAGVRRAAAAALGDLGRPLPEALTALDRAASGADPSLRRAARRSLEKLGGGS